MMTLSSEEHKMLNGLDLPTAEAQASHIITQIFEGLHAGEGNRITRVREYLVMQLEAAEERGAARFARGRPDG